MRKRMTKMTDDVRRAVEMFCLTGAVFTSILMSLHYTTTENKIEKCGVVFAIVGFTIVFMIYFAFRMRAESKKAISEEASNQ